MTTIARVPHAELVAAAKRITALRRAADLDRLITAGPPPVTVNPVTVKVDRDRDRDLLTVTPGDVVNLAGIPGRSRSRFRRYTDMTVTQVDRDPDPDPDRGVTVRVTVVGDGGFRDTVTVDLDSYTVTVTGSGSTRCACAPEVKVGGHWQGCHLFTPTGGEEAPVVAIEVMVETLDLAGGWVSVDSFEARTRAHTEADYATVADGYADAATREWGRVRVSVWCRCCRTAAHVERGDPTVCVGEALEPVA